MSKPTKSGVDMGKVTFSSNGKSYTTTTLKAGDLAGLNVKQADAIVASGGAAEVPYLSQFPWTVPA